MSYFDYLCGLVGNENIEILKVLDSYIYIYHLILDENRAKGGLHLRERFAREEGLVMEDVRETDCSVLEMMISLSELMSDQLEGYEPCECFWIMIDNLGLKDFRESTNRILIENFLNNNYSNFNGGLFQLYEYNGDIRGLDLYSQMNAWISENFPHINIF